MRRRATVTISAPEAASASSICSSERKPPVPAISREDHSRPPSSQVSAPPWIAASTSTLAPSASGVASHSARGTTSPSRATATPRASASAPLSRTASASVAPSGSSRGSPFSSILIARPHGAVDVSSLCGQSRPPRPSSSATASRSAAPAGSRCGSGRTPRAGRRRAPGPTSGRLSGVPGRSPAVASTSSISATSGSSR